MKLTEIRKMSGAITKASTTRAGASALLTRFGGQDLLSNKAKLRDQPIASARGQLPDRSNDLSLQKNSTNSPLLNTGLSRAVMQTKRQLQIKDPSQRPQKSFSSEKAVPKDAETGTLQSAREPITLHKRNKTFGEKPEFLLTRKPTSETPNSALMKKLSDKLQLDMGKLQKDKGTKHLDLMKKRTTLDSAHLAGAHSRQGSFEQSSLAKRIAEMKTSTSRPLTERANLNHIGRNLLDIRSW